MTEGWIAVAGVVFAAIVSFFTARETAQRAAEQDLVRLCEEMKLEYSVETAIRGLLSNKNYKKRSLRKIKHHLRGFETEGAVRPALIRGGAVAFSGQGDEEMWGPISRNTEDFK